MTKDELKAKYLEYYADLPVQKYACMYIGKSEDTLIRWRQEDENFANRLQELRAKWVAKKVSKAKVEFALERLEREVFKDTKEILVINPVEQILKQFGVENDVRETKEIENTSSQDNS